MAAIRRWNPILSSNPFTTHGRRRRQRTLSRTRKKVERQLTTMGRAITTDIKELAASYGMTVWPRAGSSHVTFRSITNGDWRKILLRDFHTEEDLLRLPMFETGLNASLLLVASCGRKWDDICAMLLSEPNSDWFKKLKQQYWLDDPHSETKLQISAELIHDEVMKKLRQFGFTMGEPLRYAHFSTSGTPLTLFPLYSEQRFGII